MHKRWINSGLVGIMLVVALGLGSPPNVAAQDPLTQSFTTSDGRLTVDYPETWGATELLGVLLCNDADLLENFDFETLPDDTFLLYILAGRIDELLSLSGDATFEDVLEYAQEDAETSFVEYVGPKVEEFGGHRAYRTIGRTRGEEAVYMYIDWGDGNILVVVVIANHDVIQNYGKTIEAVVMSAQYDAPAPPPQPVEAGSVIWQDMESYDYDDYAPIGAIAVGADDTIYVAGYFSGINVYNPDGVLDRVIGESSLSNRWGGYAEDLAVASDGTLWVVDADQHVTHIRDNGAILSEWGELGVDSGEFGEYSPSEIEVALDGRIITLDRQDDEDFYTVARIQIWDEDGTLLDEYAPKPSGPDSSLTGYADIEMGPDGMLYIAADYDLWRMDLDTGEMTPVSFDPVLLDYAYIQAFAINAAGEFIVASSSGVFYLLDANGGYISQFGQEQPYSDSEAPAFTEGEFYSPQGIAVLSNGQVVVSDYNYSWWQVVLFTFEE